MNKWWMSAVLLCASAWGANAQQTDMKISGTIFNDKEEAIYYANVIAYKQSDSLIQDETYTNEAGVFELQLPTANYFIVLTNGLDLLDTIQISGKDGVQNLGTIILKNDVTNLEDVVILGEKSLMELKLDKRVYNVAADLNNQGANASEMLENIPSIAVDAEGNVSLRGSQNVRILIDGKYSGFASTGDALKQLQADRIEKVEIITNASSRYDAQGESGIINIILKKDAKAGISGVVNLRAGYPLEYGAGLSLNYRKNKWNWNFSYNFNHDEHPGNSTTYQRLSNADTFFAYRQLYKSQRNKSRHDASLGVDYDIDDHNTLGAVVRMRTGLGKNNYDRGYYILDAADATLGLDSRIEDAHELEDLLEASLSYRKKLKKEGGSWNTEVQWFRDQDFERSDYAETSYDLPGVQLERSKAYVTEQYVLVQSDLVLPIGKEGKIELGTRNQLKSMNNDFGFSRAGISGWEYPSQYNDIFDYNENVYAAYVMGSNTYNKWGVQAGLRGEFSDINTYQYNLDERIEKRYFNLFPSAALSYKLTEQSTLQMSYSKRIQRPGQWDLMPFMKFGDNREMRIGNADINPEFTDVLEAGFMQYFNTGSILASVYYRHTVDKIERMAMVGDDGIIYRIPMNIANRDAIGVEVNANYNPWNWLRLSTGFNVYNETIAGRYQEQDFERSSLTWTNRTSANVTLPAKFRMQISSNYMAPRVNPQGKTLAVFHADFGLSKDVLDNKATIGFNVRDMFNTRRWKSETETDQLYSVSDFQWRPRSFRLTFSYRFNQKPGEKIKEPQMMEEYGE